MRRREKMDNKGFLVLIAVALIVILGVLVYQGQRREAPLDERIGNSVNEVVEEVQDEVDDNTTTR
jgi:sensor domain CHASE-containing protein